jgi:hypothetical protein
MTGAWPDNPGHKSVIRPNIILSRKSLLTRPYRAGLFFIYPECLPEPQNQTLAGYFWGVRGFHTEEAESPYNWDCLIALRAIFVTPLARGLRRVKDEVAGYR